MRRSIPQSPTCIATAGHWSTHPACQHIHHLMPFALKLLCDSERLEYSTRQSTHTSPDAVRIQDISRQRAAGMLRQRQHIHPPVLFALKVFCDSGTLEYSTGGSTHASFDAARNNRGSPQNAPAHRNPGCQSRQMQCQRSLAIVTIPLPMMRTPTTGCESECECHV